MLIVQSGRITMSAHVEVKAITGAGGRIIRLMSWNIAQIMITIGLTQEVFYPTAKTGHLMEQEQRKALVAGRGMIICIQQLDTVWMMVALHLKCGGYKIFPVEIITYYTKDRT